MKRLNLKFLALMLGLWAVMPSATTFASEPVVIGERITIASEILGEERHIMVSMPEGYVPGTKLPVLYVLDAESHFKAFAGIVDYLGRDTNMPPMVVVGLESNSNREHNMVPYKSDWSPNGGGAGGFMGFFKDELIPYVDSHYATTGFNMLAGKSYGGLFALWAATQADSPFKAYIAASPSVFLADSQIVKDLWAARETVAMARFIYVTHANEDDIMRKPFTEVAGMLERIMQGKNATGHKFYMDEMHETVFLPSFTDGLKVMFRGWQVPRYTQRLGAEEVVAHYQVIIDRLGLNMEIPERAFSYLGNLARSDRDYQTSFEIYLEGVKRHQNSALAEYYLARGLAKLDRAKDAAKHMQLAADKAVKLGMVDAADYQDMANQYKAAVE